MFCNTHLNGYKLQNVLLYAEPQRGAPQSIGPVTVA